MYELGIRVNGAQLDNNPDFFIKNLNVIKETGFTAIEICPDDFDAIGYGELDLKIVEKLKSILSDYQFEISTHVPSPLNLFNRDELSIHKKVLEASIEFTHQIGGNLMVYHPGRYVDNIEFTRYGKPELSSTEKKKLRKKEAIFLQNLADRYPDIMIAMENLRPYIDFSPYTYAEHIDKLADQVENINKKNVGLMIDTGHMLLSSKYFGYDFMEIIYEKKINPVHFHVNDNHGITTFYTEKDKKQQHPFGRGDEHIVPGTGIFPFRDFFKQFPDYKGRYIIELTNRLFYPAKIKESYNNLKSFLEK
jgi:sugar phosphate isomerase/epimerase